MPSPCGAESAGCSAGLAQIRPSPLLRVGVRLVVRPVVGKRSRRRPLPTARREQAPRRRASPRPIAARAARGTRPPVSCPADHVPALIQRAIARGLAARTFGCAQNPSSTLSHVTSQSSPSPPGQPALEARAAPRRAREPHDRSLRRGSVRGSRQQPVVQRLAVITDHRPRPDRQSRAARAASASRPPAPWRHTELEQLRQSRALRRISLLCGASVKRNYRLGRRPRAVSSSRIGVFISSPRGSWPGVPAPGLLRWGVLGEPLVEHQADADWDRSGAHRLPACWTSRGARATSAVELRSRPPCAGTASEKAVPSPRKRICLSRFSVIRGCAHTLGRGRGTSHLDSNLWPIGPWTRVNIWCSIELRQAPIGSLCP